MSDFRKLSDQIWASPQITLEDVAEAKERGFAMIVNNRPEGESDDQTPGITIAQAAEAGGMAYHAIPITHAGFSDAQVNAMNEALDSAEGPVLAYCRSGTRSTLLWSLAKAKKGMGIDEIAQAAANAGYDVSPVRPALENYAAQAGE